MIESNPIEDARLQRLRREIEQDINEYVYEVPEGSIGKPILAAAIAEELAEMRAALIDPRWVVVEIRDTVEQSGMNLGSAPHRKCVAVADDRKGMVLLFDPLEDSFVLAQRGEMGLWTFNVRGDAVGCFLSR